MVIALCYIYMVIYMVISCNQLYIFDDIYIYIYIYLMMHVLNIISPI